MKHRSRRFACLVLLTAVAAIGCGATSVPAPESTDRTVRLAPETSPAPRYAAQTQTQTPRPSVAASTRSTSSAGTDPGKVAAQFVIDSQRCYVDAAAARALRDHAAPAVADRAIRDAKPGLDTIAPRTITVTVTGTAMLDTDENSSRRQYRVTFDRTATGPDGVSSVTRAMSLNVSLDRISDRWVVSQVTAAAN